MESENNYDAGHFDTTMEEIPSQVIEERMYLESAFDDLTAITFVFIDIIRCSHIKNIMPCI